MLNYLEIVKSFIYIYIYIAEIRLVDIWFIIIKYVMWLLVILLFQPIISA